MYKYQTPLVIFAGGKSSRMGEDKALLPFGEFPTLAQYQYEKFRKHFNQIYLSSKANKFDFDCQVIIDCDETYSPLIALESILQTLKVPGIFVLSVDAPFVSIEVINRVLSHQEEPFDAIIAQSSKGLQPLCGYYATSILPFIEYQLEQNQHKLTTLLSLANSKIIPFKEETLFENLNYPEEYHKARHGMCK